MRNRDVALNILGNGLLFLTNLLFGFFFAPYIVRTIGVEANGFIVLSENIVGYVALIGIALNSMASRFITISIKQEKKEEALSYYSVVMAGNVILSLVYGVIFAIILFNLDSIFSIPTHLVFDVTLLFTLVFVNFMITSLFSLWEVATFVTNKIYIASLYRMISQLLRIGVIVSLFYFLAPSVYFAGIGFIVASIFVALVSFYYKKKLLPQIKISLSHLNVHHLKVLLAAGIWNSISQMGTLLLTGIGLFVANIMVGPIGMGLLALAKILPMVLLKLSATLRSAFMPSFTILYAENNIKALESSIKKSLKILSVFISVPLCILIVYGADFFSLWVPTEDANQLHILATISVSGLVLTSGTQALYNVFTVVNKVKINAIMVLLSGVASTLLMIILLNFTSLGLLAIVLSTTIINIIRNMGFTLPYAAIFLNLKWNTFFSNVGISVLNVSLLLVVGIVVRRLLVVDSWFSLFYSTFLAGLLGIVTSTFIVLDRDERSSLTLIIKNKLKKVTGADSC